jgi:hypothetical protein
MKVENLIGKKIVQGIAVVILLFSVFLMGCQSTGGDLRRQYKIHTSGKYKYTLDDNGNAEIVEYTGKSTDLVIPETLDGHKVTSLAGTIATYEEFFDEWFAGISTGVFKDKGLTSVILPNGLIFTGDNTFENNNLTSITIPFGVKNIGHQAFSNNKLTSITIPESVMHLSGFDNNFITELIIPEGVEVIGTLAFANNKITSLVIPATVKTIWDNAFASNPLTNVTLYGTLEKFDYNFIGSFTKFYLAYGRKQGQYVLQDNKCYLNGDLLPTPAVLRTSAGVHIIAVDGQTIGDKFEGHLLGDTRYFIPPGRHTITVNYKVTEGNVTTYSLGNTNFNYTYLFDGRNYTITARIEGDIIYYNIN